MSNFGNPFANRMETLDQSRVQSHALVQEGEHATEPWPSTHAMLTAGMIPLLKSWLNRLRAAMKPIYLWPVQIERLGLKRYIGVTWWHPNSLRLRVQIGGLWFLLQGYHLRNWLHALYRAGVQWCIRHRRLLLWAAVLLVGGLLLWLWVWLFLFIGERIIDKVFSIWKSIFGL